jgi:hypothetical protein
MTATQVIAEISALPQSERRRVIQFTRQLEMTEPMTPEELGALASRLADADESTASRLQNEIMNGFYGRA